MVCLLHCIMLCNCPHLTEVTYVQLNAAVYAAVYAWIHKCYTGTVCTRQPTPNVKCRYVQVYMHGYTASNPTIIR